MYGHMLDYIPHRAKFIGPLATSVLELSAMLLVSSVFIDTPPFSLSHVTEHIGVLLQQLSWLRIRREV